MMEPLNLQDEKTVTMLRKSLDTITMERDAAFISRVGFVTWVLYGILNNM